MDDDELERKKVAFRVQSKKILMRARKHCREARQLNMNARSIMRETKKMMSELKSLKKRYEMARQTPTTSKKVSDQVLNDHSLSKGQVGDDTGATHSTDKQDKESTPNQQN